MVGPAAISMHSCPGITRAERSQLAAYEGINHCQNPDFAAGSQLVVYEVHRPDMVRMGRLRAVGSKLRLDPTLRNLVAELEVHLLVKTIDSLRINRPSITPEQDMDATITVAYARLADVPNLQLQFGLLATFGLVDIERPVNLQHRAYTPDRNLPVRLDCVDKPALAGRPQSFLTEHPGA